MTIERRSTVTVVVDRLDNGGREVRVHLDPMGLQALREGQPIIAVFDGPEAEVLGLAQVVVTTAPPPEDASGIGGTVLRLV